LQLEQSHALHDFPSAAQVCVPDTPPAQLHRCVELGVQPDGSSEHDMIAIAVKPKTKKTKARIPP
jgi:hypothetical protein